MTKTKDTNIQTENLNSLGFVTPLLKRNLIIAIISILLIANIYQNKQSNKERLSFNEERSSFRKEISVLNKEFLTFTKEQIYQRDSLLEKQRILELKQKHVIKKLNKLTDD